MQNTRLVSPNVAAEILGTTPAFVRDMCRKGKLPCVKIGGIWRVNIDGIKEIISATLTQDHTTTE